MIVVIAVKIFFGAHHNIRNLETDVVFMQPEALRREKSCLYTLWIFKVSYVKSKYNNLDGKKRNKNARARVFEKERESC
jgi:hypothetical protein